jgi:hypothetical protein
MTKNKHFSVMLILQMKSVAFRSKFFSPNQLCAPKWCSPKCDLDTVQIQQSALSLSSKIYNRMPIIQTLSNINILWVFSLCQMTLNCFENRINVAEGDMILLEEPHRLNTWVKNPVINWQLMEILIRDQFFKLGSPSFRNALEIDT